MGGNFQASPDEMADFARGVEQRHRDLIARIVALKDDEDRTTATWSGNARGAFDGFMETYYRLADKQNDELAQNAENLIKVGSAYEEADRTYAERIQRQVSSLDLPPLPS